MRDMANPKLQIFQVTLLKEFDVYVEATSQAEVEIAMRRVSRREIDGEWDPTDSWDVRVYPLPVFRGKTPKPPQGEELMGVIDGEISNSGDWQDWKDAHFDDLIEAGAGHEDDVSLPLLSSDGTSPPTEKK